ncbi:MAG: metal-dependent hydrolase [Oleiphilaceae bacterium]|nr:metal-dependent hydrolase [Oleiphilaceae bacterium]
MDSITQAALGAVLGGAIAGKTLGRTALLAGAVLGTLPDMDVVIDYGSAVANFTQHRGFSHSLFILVPVAVLLAFVGRRWRPDLSLRHWLAFTGLILVTHPLLDCLTTYGTQLFWPLGAPIATASIFIIDPLYTLPLIAAIALALWRPPSSRALGMGLLISTLYLGWSVTAQQLISARVAPALAAENASDSPRLIQPMPLTTILWRVTVMGPNERLEIVTGFLDKNLPLKIERFPYQPELEGAALQFPEGRRLDWFTEGFLAYQELDGKLTATDIRLGVPAAHPFTFVLAQKPPEADTTGWQPVTSYKTSGPETRASLFKALWQRLTGTHPVLCLATMETGPIDMSCS